MRSSKCCLSAVVCLLARSAYCVRLQIWSVMRAGGASVPDIAPWQVRAGLTPQHSMPNPPASPLTLLQQAQLQA